MQVSSMGSVQTEYIRELVWACPALEDQLADIYHVLTVVADGGDVREESALDSARAAYVAHLRQSQLTFDQLVANIAAVCACVFLQESPGVSRSVEQAADGGLLVDAADRLGEQWGDGHLTDTRLGRRLGWERHGIRDHHLF